MECLSISQICEMLIKVSADVVESEKLLTEVDLVSGDGDHGISMALGFGELKNMLSCSKDYMTVQDLFIAAGTKLIDTMGGASGVLFGTFFISGIRNVESKYSLSLNDFALFFFDAFNKISERGRAKPGDKTMLDALYPAALALQEASERSLSLTEAFSNAAEKAKSGVEATRDMIASAGRAKDYKELSLGHQDAGATSIFIIVNAMYEYIASTEKSTD